MQATTAFGVEGFVRGAMCARHARRGTVMPHDYRLHGMLQNVRAGDVVAVPPPPPKQVKVKPAETPKVEKAGESSVADPENQDKGTPNPP